MTFSSDSSMVVKMGYSEKETSAMVVESGEARKHLRKLGRVIKIVATHRLKELRHLQAVEKLATWRRTCGFDRLADGDDSWVHRNLPTTPEQIAASLWADLKELKYAISMSGKDGSRQKVGSFISEIEQGTVSDEEFARIERLVERRCRDAAHVTIAPVGTAQYCSPRSPGSETSFDTHVYVEKKDEDMEEKDEGRMDLEQDQLESSSASTGFETPGQQCHPNWETGQTTAAGACPRAWVRILGERGNTLSLAEITKPPSALNTISCRRAASLRPTKKTNNSTPVRGCTGSLLFPGGNLGLGARCMCLCFVCACLSVVFCF